MDTDPTPEVSSLLDALSDTPLVDETSETAGGSETDEGTQEQSSADEEQQQQEATEDASAALKVEFDGKTWELPPGTPPEIAAGVAKMANELKADYTQKRQADAAEAKRVSETAKTLGELAQISQATQSKVIEAALIQRQIQQIEAIDFASLVDSDPQQAIKLQAQHSRLTAQLNQQQAELNQLRSAEYQKLNGEIEQRRAHLLKSAPDVIPGFNEKINLGLREAVEQCGFAPDELTGSGDVRMLKLINLARIGMQYQAVQPKTLQKAPAKAPGIKPAAPVPQQTRQNAEATKRLKQSGRASDLISFL
jgi:hypothetical protein